MTVGVAISEPIAANFYCPATILAEAFPSHFVSFDTAVADPSENEKIAKGLSGQVVLHCELGASA